MFVSGSLTENLKSAIFSVIALSIPTIAILYRALRAWMNDVLNRDYVTYARANGFAREE